MWGHRTSSPDRYRGLHGLPEPFESFRRSAQSELVILILPASVRFTNSRSRVVTMGFRSFPSSTSGFAFTQTGAWTRCYEPRREGTCLDPECAWSFSGNSKPTLPSSNFRYAENGRPRFEMKPSNRSVLPVVRSFCACSFGMSRPRIVLFSLNLQGFRSEERRVGKECGCWC